METWENIKDFEGLYQVSNLGRVRSLDRWTNSKCGSMQLKKGRILKQGLNKCGYQLVHLCKDGKGKTYTVHRLVADAFIPNPQNLKEINHIDEDKTNNRVCNLEWCDRSYNINFGTLKERISKSLKGKPNIALSKRVAQIDKDTDEIIKIWPSTMECDRNGFYSGVISQCCRNCYYGSNIYKGFKWQYVNDSFYSIQNCSTIDFPILDEQCIM